ncbi:hypothetical protein Avbf_12194 [Armadillidium vulgare]|nr:hypothetical protein Avbf_12194 [Armadillidium vulgare]
MDATSDVRTGTNLQKPSEQEINFTERNTEEQFSSSPEKPNVSQNETIKSAHLTIRSFSANFGEMHSTISSSLKLNLT